MLLHGDIEWNIINFLLQGTLCFYTEPLDLKWNPDVHCGTLRYLMEH